MQRDDALFETLGKNKKRKRRKIIAVVSIGSIAADVSGRIRAICGEQDMDTKQAAC